MRRPFVHLETILLLIPQFNLLLYRALLRRRPSASRNHLIDCHLFVFISIPLHVFKMPDFGRVPGLEPTKFDPNNADRDTATELWVAIGA